MPLRFSQAALGFFAAATLLAACSTGGQDSPINVEVFPTSDQFEPETPDLNDPTVIAGAQKVAIAKVDRLEFGVTFDGVLLSAFGEASSTGWFQPRLIARNGGQAGPDGFIEFDFVAASPELNGGTAGVTGTERQRALRAEVPLTSEMIAGKQGVRVYSANNAVAARF